MPKLLVEMYDEFDKKFAERAMDRLAVYVRRDFGCLRIEVDSAGQIHLETQDGDGKTLERSNVNPDHIVGDGVADPEDDANFQLKVLGDMNAALAEAGIGPQPNPLHDEPEGQEAGGQEEGTEEADDRGGPEEGGTNPAGAD